ncbi:MULTISPECIES: serine/threonine-protein kinase [Streptomyces]|uniref:serine/threonine-protein kinase n=1 Tax=Streptomyces TaxID=1883 RepID=UPI00073DF159|nr:serine/threonine-protein kinase [Streptomyces sp. EAS-AB2608]CUW32879.1 Serine/threonine-protein kinase AfsK [Streptomyces reticuli]
MTAGIPGERLGAEDPREVAGYRLLARIGEGGMGTVYLSRTRGGQPVALKVIRREYGGDPGFRRRFEQEVRAARRVQGYHVVPVVDHDTGGEQPWLASVFIPGLPLHEALAAHGPLPPASVLQLVGGTAKALTAIHSAGIVHRDLKPSNILLSREGPYVIDFGIARAPDATQLTLSGGVVGTPQFMSPEQALGEPVGPATDVFSLGLIAAVAATGRHPYGDGGALALAARIANTAQQPPRLDGHDDRLRPLLERCLATAPDRRIGTEELAALCERAVGRSLRDFTGWLPEPLTADLTARERALLTAPAEPTAADTAATASNAAGSGGLGPSPAAPTATPTTATTPNAADSGRVGPSSAAPHGPTFAGAPTMAPPPPAYAPPATAPARRTPTVGVLVGAAVAVVLAVVATWTLTRPDGTSGEVRSGGKEPSGHGSSAPADPSPATGDDAGYAVVFKDRPLALRSPSGANIVTVDLDVPQVVQDTPGREIKLSEISGGRWEFYTPMGRSTGTTPAECLAGARSDVLPQEIEAADLRTTIPVGTRLCTVTTDDRLALLKVTRITAATDGNLPDYTAELTLWQKR